MTEEEFQIEKLEARNRELTYNMRTMRTTMLRELKQLRHENEFLRSSNAKLLQELEDVNNANISI